MNLTHKKSHFYFVNLAVLTAVFFALYHEFILGDKMYAYVDGGSDTVMQYLPVMSFDLKTIFSGKDGFYNLQFGFGRLCGGLLAKYLNPANLLILIFGEKNLPAGILAATYVKYVGIWLFSFGFFKRLFGNDKTAAACALLWTFSGYAVIWGQHYNFLTAILAFTVAMYGFQLFLQEDKKQWLVVPCIAYLAGVSYFFLYTSCFFFLVYGVCYLHTRGMKTAQILKKIGWFLPGFILALLMSAVYLFPSISDFFSSARMQDVTAEYESKSIFYGSKTIFAFLSRIFSNDLIGVGDAFQGPANYYECAILSISVLFVISIVHLLRSRYWRQTAIFTAVCLVLLFMPVTSKILSFDEDRQRWAYIICFTEVIVIGLALSDYISKEEESRKKHFLTTLLVADGVVFISLFVFFIFFGETLNTKACIIIALSLFIYNVCFIGTAKFGHFSEILLVCIALELVLINYPAINERVSPTKDEWNNAMYHDGTEEVVQWIHEQDESLYRISKTYAVSDNDPLIQGYNGTSVYLSTNQSELIQLAESYGHYNAGNWICFSGSDFLSNTMLGVKYVISHSESTMDPSRYELLFDNGTHTVYRNKYWLGFGYLYQDQMPESVFLSATKHEKHLMLSRYFYADNVESADYSMSDAVQKVNLFPYLNGYVNCEVTMADGMQIHGTAEDMQLYFDVSQFADEWYVAGIQLNMTQTESSVVQMYVATPEVGYCEQNSRQMFYEAGEAHCTLENPVTSAVTGLRLDPGSGAQDIKMQSLDLILVKRDQLEENLRTLQENAITDVKQYNNAFSCNVSNPYEKDAMLCVPLIYSKYWKAHVDGVPTEVVNINGGLVGIAVTQGLHEIELEYSNDCHQIGLGISLFAIILWLLSVYKMYHPKRKEKRYDQL